jgi:hypothetical protein
VGVILFFVAYHGKFANAAEISSFVVPVLTIVLGILGVIASFYQNVGTVVIVCRGKRDGREGEEKN